MKLVRISHRDLADGQRFTIDGGTTWHTTAVPLFGSVAVYITEDRDEDTAPTIRIDVPEDDMVEVEATPQPAYYPCLLCDHSYLNADTLIRHYGREHSPTLTTTMAVYGRTCPECGRVFTRLDQHTSRTHNAPLAWLFANVRDAGDPRGVVASRIEHLNTTLLPESRTTMELSPAELDYLARCVDLGRSDPKASAILAPDERDTLLRKLGGRRES